MSSTALDDPQPTGRVRTTGDLIRTGIRGVGQTLITVGVVLLLFVVYTLYITNIFAARDQRALNNDLAETWASQAQVPVEPGKTAPAPIKPGIGEAFARIYIPAIGVGMGDPRAVVEGVATADLKKGPGHLPGTALPGEVGNLVISGHRTTYGAPFNKIDQVDAGDEIIIETATSYFTYRMTSRQIVKPSQFEVTFPVPNMKDAKAVKKLITLTTCNPKYSAKQRLIVYGELAKVDLKSAGLKPAALQGKG